MVCDWALPEPGRASSASIARAPASTTLGSLRITGPSAGLTSGADAPAATGQPPGGPRRRRLGSLGPAGARQGEQREHRQGTGEHHVGESANHWSLAMLAL